MQMQAIRNCAHPNMEIPGAFLPFPHRFLATWPPPHIPTCVDYHGALHLHIKRLGWEGQIFVGYMNDIPGQPNLLSPMEIRHQLLQPPKLAVFCCTQGSLSQLGAPLPLSLYGGASSFFLANLLNSLRCLKPLHIYPCRFI